jgi:hypothetical protein
LDVEKERGEMDNTTRQMPTPPAEIVAAAVELARTGKAVGAVLVLAAPRPSHVTSGSERAATRESGGICPASAGEPKSAPLLAAQRSLAPDETYVSDDSVVMSEATAITNLRHPYAVTYCVDGDGAA